jgi:hypothetical protein
VVPANAAPPGVRRRSYSAVILTEGGDEVAGAKPDPTPSRPAERDGAGPEPADRDGAAQVPAGRPRVARRPPSTGPVLPDVTDDERDVGWGDAPEPDDDERLRREVPPHHGS